MKQKNSGLQVTLITEKSNWLQVYTITDYVYQKSVINFMSIVVLESPLNNRHHPSFLFDRLSFYHKAILTVLVRTTWFISYGTQFRYKLIGFGLYPLFLCTLSL